MRRFDINGLGGSFGGALIGAVLFGVTAEHVIAGILTAVIGLLLCVGSITGPRFTPPSKPEEPEEPAEARAERVNREWDRTSGDGLDDY